MSGKTHSSHEMLLRELGIALKLGFQCHLAKYNPRFLGEEYLLRNHRRWYISIWDQRPGHYTKIKPGEAGHNSGPSQKWSNNQDTDFFVNIFDKEDPAHLRSKDDFIDYLLFDEDSKFYANLPMATQADSFKQLMLLMDIMGINRDKVDKWYQEVQKEKDRAV